MMLVVPPHAAARVPVSNVSIAAVPPKGSSMWVWASMPPGITYLPDASTTVSTDAATSVPRSSDPGCSTATIVSPSMSTSASLRPVADTTVPFWMSVVVMISIRSFVATRSPGSGLRDHRVRVGPAVPVELPVVAHLPDHVHVEIADQQLLVGAGTALAHEVPARVDDLAGAVEVDRQLAVLVVLASDPVRLEHEVSVRDGRGGAFHLPEPVREAGLRGVRVEHDVRAVQAEFAPSL